MDVESEQHEVKTAGSIWDCSLVLAKYVAKHTETLIKVLSSLCDVTLESCVDMWVRRGSQCWSWALGR